MRRTDMMNVVKYFGRLSALAFAVGVAAAVAPAGTVLAQVGAEQAGRQFAETYDVKVLRVREGDIDGSPVWYVTVMNPGGAFNEAFKVTTVAVDKQTGQLMPSFRHRASGYELPPGRRDDKVGQRPESMRTGTWR
jgi:uncharacterized NAD-dependent epimerase/dehydratase family protein